MLTSLPGLRRDENHRYWLGDHLFPISTTGVLSYGKSQYVRDRLEQTKGEWAPRGTTVHLALELWLNDPSWRPESDRETFAPFFEWIWPLMAHPLWKQVTPIASEMMLCSKRLNLAGTFDGAFVSKTTGRRALFDLKTQNRPDATPYSTRAQLGCYMVMAAEHGLEFDGGVTVWARPGGTMVQSFTVEECIEAWEKKWQAYCEAERTF